MIQINIIPTNHSPNYKDALAYVDGDDRFGGVAARKQAISELEEKGLVVVDTDNMDKIMVMAKAGATIEARVTCMWCGGASYVAYRLPADTDIDVAEREVTPVNAGEEQHETSVIVATLESLSIAEMDANNIHHPGWCNKCHTYCYGDCQAQEG